MALRRRLPSLALTAASVGALAWLVVAQHDQLGRAIAGIGHARARLIVAAIVCERVSMFSLARMQRRLLPDRGQHLTLLCCWSAGSSSPSSGSGGRVKPRSESSLARPPSPVSRTPTRLARGRHEDGQRGGLQSRGRYVVN
jgi:hypothetical protein